MYMKKSFLLSLIDAVVCDVVDPHTTSQGDFQRIFSAPMLDDYNAGVLFLFLFFCVASSQKSDLHLSLYTIDES